MQVLLVMYLILSLLMVIISVPLMRRMVKPNYIYGFRVRQTLSDADTWYAVNAYGGRMLFGLGIAMALCTLALYPLGFSVDGYASACAAVMLIGLSIALGLTFRYMQQYIRAKKS
jgi:uncharacterized membrane protein